MSTENLIAALAADRSRGMKPGRALAAAAAAGIAATAIVFFAFVHPRPDFMPAMHSWRFVTKFVLAFALAASASALVLRAGRPDDGHGARDRLLWIAPAMLFAALVVELFSLAPDEWTARWIGHNATICLRLIPLLSLAPLAALLLALRGAAPAMPARAGALAGLAAGGIGALFYAAHCFDDSPLFVATWYTIAITFVTLLGAWIGSRVLRW
ncbi:MAG TPA: NrsF family protein [Rhizomicrobium sp.]|nr:NrsF family protein [Rhizomicrobium sp.]